MPLNRKPLPLPPDPESVKVARQWVVDILEKLGRTDLVDAAELGVSELVTNAILHADPPISVRVRGTRAHPRVEVTDHSQRPPEVNVEMADTENLLSTIGRGLGIVALYSSTWGAELTPHGKSVWFEPSTEPQPADDLAGEVFDFSCEDEDIDGDAEPPEETVTVRLLGMPVQVFAHFRQCYSELRRELRLLALTHGADYPVARELSELSTRVDGERRKATGLTALEKAIADGAESADLEYHVPTSAPESMGRLLELLEEADAFCREQRLLTLAATPQQRDLQRWYLTEFVRQGRGEQPQAWHGGYTVERPEA